MSDPQTKTAMQSVAAYLAAAEGKVVDIALKITPAQIVDFVGMVAGAFLPGAQLLGMSIAQLTKLAAGVAAGIPEAVDAFKEISDLAEKDGAPTAEDWARWNAAADAAHSAVQAAADEVLAGSGP